MDDVGNDVMWVGVGYHNLMSCEYNNDFTKIRIKMPENTSTESRTDKIIFTQDLSGLTRTIVINQAKPDVYEFMINDM